jgi:hypothetical protein
MDRSRRATMMLGWRMLLAVFVAAAVVAIGGSAWALPTHGFDKGWSKDDGPDYKHDEEFKFSFFEGPWPGSDKVYGFDEDFDKKWGKGYGKYDPECEPPVPTPEPATLLLLGSTLAGVGAATRWRARGQARQS